MDIIKKYGLIEICIIFIIAFISFLVSFIIPNSFEFVLTIILLKLLFENSGIRNKHAERVEDFPLYFYFLLTIYLLWLPFSNSDFPQNTVLGYGFSWGVRWLLFTVLFIVLFAWVAFNEIHCSDGVIKTYPIERSWRSQNSLYYIHITIVRYSWALMYVTILLIGYFFFRYDYPIIAEMAMAPSENVIKNVVEESPVCFPTPIQMIPSTSKSSAGTIVDFTSRIAFPVLVILFTLLTAAFTYWKNRVMTQGAEDSHNGFKLNQLKEGLSMLGQTNIFDKLAGIYYLLAYAEDNLNDPRNPNDCGHVFNILCGFVRRETIQYRDNEGFMPIMTKDAIQLILNQLFVNIPERNRFGGSFRATLSLSCLRDMRLIDADLTGANLRSCILNDSSLRNAKLDRANLVLANLSECCLCGSSLKNATLCRAQLTGACFSEATILNQAEFYGVFFPIPNVENTPTTEIDSIRIFNFYGEIFGMTADQKIQWLRNKGAIL